MAKILIPAVVALCLAASAAYAQPPAAPAAATAPAGKLSSKSMMSALMANPASKAVLKKYIPQVVDYLEANGTGDMDLPLDALSQIPEAGVTPELLKSINDDLTKI